MSYDTNVVKETSLKLAPHCKLEAFEKLLTDEVFELLKTVTSNPEGGLPEHLQVLKDAKQGHFGLGFDPIIIGSSAKENVPETWAGLGIVGFFEKETESGTEYSVTVSPEFVALREMYIAGGLFGLGWLWRDVQAASVTPDPHGQAIRSWYRNQTAGLPDAAAK